MRSVVAFVALLSYYTAGAGKKPCKSFSVDDAKLVVKSNKWCREWLKGVDANVEAVVTSDRHGLNVTCKNGFVPEGGSVRVEGVNGSIWEPKGKYVGYYVHFVNMCRAMKAMKCVNSEGEMGTDEGTGLELEDSGGEAGDTDLELEESGDASNPAETGPEGGSGDKGSEDGAEKKIEETGVVDDDGSGPVNVGLEDVGDENTGGGNKKKTKRPRNQIDTSKWKNKYNRCSDKGIRRAVAQFAEKFDKDVPECVKVDTDGSNVVINCGCGSSKTIQCKQVENRKGQMKMKFNMSDFFQKLNGICSECGECDCYTSLRR